MEDKKNIHQRILAVMAEIDYVKKESKKVNNQYTFVSHDAVTALLHPQFVKHGIVVAPSVTLWQADGNRVIAELQVEFINADAPDDRISIMALGYGIDPQDKGPGKAVSYAYKYALLKMFALETGDDPERDDVDYKSGKKEGDSTPQNHRQPNTEDTEDKKWQDYAKDVRVRVAKAKDPKEIDAIMTEDAMAGLKKYSPSAYDYLQNHGAERIAAFAATP